MAMDPVPENVSAPGLRRKLAWRILPLVFVLYVIAYLDRANIAFASLGMRKSHDSWLTDDVYGWGTSIFYAGYLILEIPGALIVEHWSARKWFARILITWGICSMAFAFVETAWHFYVARFLLGLAEAGFFPGVIVYFTHWFPRADRGRALSCMIFGIPISGAIGSQLAAYLMSQSWFGLDGWQWVFLIEGAPAVLLGVLVPFLLTDWPSQATWLTPAERAWLTATLERERAEAQAAGSIGLGQVLRQPTVWILALGILVTNTGGYALGFWLPTFLDNMLKAPADTAFASTNALHYIGLVYLAQIAGVFVSGQSSDRTGERKWHCIFGQVGAGVFLVMSLIPLQPFALVMVWLCCMGFCALFWPSPFWVLPTMSMSPSAAAVSIAFINICANLAFGPAIVGMMKTFGFEDAACMLLLAGCYVAGGVIIAMLRVRARGG